MSTITVAPDRTVQLTEPPRAPGRHISAIATLSARRFALSARTPREIFVPLLTPILFACVIAPALAKSVGDTAGLDYLSFVAVGTIGLLIPVSCVFGGVGMIVDRLSGAQRDLLAAPVPRRLLVFGNLSVAIVLSAFQVVALMVAAVLRGATFNTGASDIAWTAAAALGLAVAMHGCAEILAARLPTQEEYVGAAPPIALLPWFFAGSFFPITAMPIGLTWLARLLPLTHALALMRYGLVDPHGRGLHDIWQMNDTTVMAWMSLLVVAVFALLMTALAIRVFTRSAVR
jgi:ABC-type polysaccharide/polyol phosphate export permease